MTRKQQQRKKAYSARKKQVDKDFLSGLICEKVMAQPDYQRAKTVMWYLHCRSEVRTLNTVAKELQGSTRIVVPYCTFDEVGQRKLGLWLLKDLSELTSGTWDILEPPKTRWGEAFKEIPPQELDLIIVPGVAFDRNGGRLGNGAGYYDRLLAEVRSDTILTAVCFESQLVEEVIMQEHDVYMDNVLTEKNCYRKLMGKK